LERLHDSLWIQDDDGSLAGLRLRRRATVVQLAGGGLWVHSPTPLTPRFQSELVAIDEVAFLVAPSNGHCSWIGDWANAYPRAEIHVAAGVPAKQSRLRVDRIMSLTVEPRWASDFDQSTMIGAPLFDESVFLHKASRSLIVSDLIQNHNRSDQRGVGKLIARFASERRGVQGTLSCPSAEAGRHNQRSRGVRCVSRNDCGMEFRSDHRGAGRCRRKPCERRSD